MSTIGSKATFGAKIFAEGPRAHEQLQLCACNVVCHGWVGPDSERRRPRLHGEGRMVQCLQVASGTGRKEHRRKAQAPMSAVRARTALRDEATLVTWRRGRKWDHVDNSTSATQKQ